MLERWREWARRLAREIRALSVAMRDPRTPWYARALAVVIVAYAVSPIDLIPDPIPVLGLLDDLLLLPLGVLLVKRWIPDEALAEARDATRQSETVDAPGQRVVTVAIVVAWVASILLGLYLFFLSGAAGPGV